MGGRPDDDRQLPFFLGAADDSVDAFDEGTGGVDDLHAPALQFLIYRPTDAVGTDDHRLAGASLLRGVDHLHTQGAEFVHDVVIVNDWPQRDHLFPRFCRLLHQLHRPTDAEAEPGAFRDPDAHSVTFRAMISFIAAITPSMSSSEVSSLMLSRAIFRGAISRWVS